MKIKLVLSADERNSEKIWYALLSILRAIRDSL